MLESRTSYPFNTYMYRGISVLYNGLMKILALLVVRIPWIQVKQ